MWQLGLRESEMPTNLIIYSSVQSATSGVDMRKLIKLMLFEASNVNWGCSVKWGARGDP
jgi:hypothetical protein